MTTALAVSGLSYAYPPQRAGDDPVQALTDVTFDVAEGEVLAVLGRVGSGKSTLCMALNGLVPHATGGVFGGQVKVYGADTRSQPVAQLARTVGLVFQDPESQLTQVRVEDEIAFGPENLGVPRGEIAERVAWALAAVGLEGYRDRFTLQLSGGERQRVAIASVLAMRPRILVLDEPTANLDPVGKRSVFRVLSRLAREHELAVVIATQEAGWAIRYAQRAVVLDAGGIAAEGRALDVLGDAAAIAALGVDVPQLAETAYLLRRATGRTYHFLTFRSAYLALREARHRTLHGSPSTLACAPPSAEPPLVRMEGVAYDYPDGTHALRGVSLEVRAGELLAIVGPNGSGKTTLAKHLNGLLRPAAGRVWVGGRDAAQVRVAELARLVGYAFQDPDHQIFAPTVRDEVAFGPRALGHGAGEVKLQTDAALSAFGLAGFADTPPALLGAGQRRQVALAATLAGGPRVLVLDEPAGELDARSRSELMAVAERFRSGGGAVILITHDMHLVAEHACRAVVLDRGRVVFDGPTAGLFAREALLAKARLEAPPVIRLARRLAGRHDAAALTTPAALADYLSARLARREAWQEVHRGA